MGKTKTVFVGEEKKEKPKKVAKVPGLKGGQRVVAIEAELPTTPEPVAQEEAALEKKEETKVKKIKVRGKKYKEARVKIDRSKLYKLEDAVKIIKETSFSKFDGTMELHMLVKKEGLSINVDLPFTYGKQKKIEIADDKTTEKLKTGKIDFEILLATPEFMPKLIPYASILGPKGLMPNPKNQTLIKSEKDALKFSGNTLRIATEKSAPIIHTIVGKVSQKDDEILKNIKVIFDAIGQKQILKAYLKSTMSPSVKVEVE